MAILLEYEADKLNGQTITYVDDGEDISEVFGPVYTWVHYGVFVVRLSLHRFTILTITDRLCSLDFALTSPHPFQNSSSHSTFDTHF